MLSSCWVVLENHSDWNTIERQLVVTAWISFARSWQSARPVWESLKLTRKFQADTRGRKSEKKVDRWCIHDPAAHFNWRTKIEHWKSTVCSFLLKVKLYKLKVNRGCTMYNRMQWPGIIFENLLRTTAFFRVLHYLRVLATSETMYVELKKSIMLSEKLGAFLRNNCSWRTAGQMYPKPYTCVSLNNLNCLIFMRHGFYNVNINDPKKIAKESWRIFYRAHGVPTAKNCTQRGLCSSGWFLNACEQKGQRQSITHTGG